MAIKKFNIKNQEDFNRIYPNLSTRDRGLAGYAFPEYYQSYMSNYQVALDRAINQAREKDIRTHKEAEDKLINEQVEKDLNLAISGRSNPTFKPWTQAERDKYKANVAKKVAQTKPTQQYPQGSIQQKIIEKANYYGIDPNIPLAVAYNESKFNPNAINISKGDKSKGTGAEKSVGLFQINTLAHPDYKGGFDIDANIDYGVKLLAGHLKATGGDVKKALARYNGSGVAAQRYADTVFPIYQNYSKGNIPNSSSTISSSTTSSIAQTQTQATQPFIPQDVQNVQEPIENRWQDIQYLNQILPALNWQQMASNISNENPKGVYNIAAQSMLDNLYNRVYNQPRQEEQSNMMNYNPYTQPRGYDNQMAPIPNNQTYDNMIGDIRGYANTNNQLAPVPNQPQNIREDVLPDYLQVMEGIRGKQPSIDYGDILNQYNQAVDADRRQNQLNQMVNAFGAFGTPSKKAPIYYVGAKGDLRSIELDQPNTIAALPTNTTSNVDKLTGQLAIQQAQAKSEAEQNKLYIDMLKAQQEREDMLAQASALAEQFGGRPEMYMNKDVVQSLLSQTINPRITGQERRMDIPLNAQADLIKQYATNAGNLVVEDVKGRYGLGKEALTQQGQAYTQGVRNAGNVDVASILNAGRTNVAQINAQSRLEALKQMGVNQQELARLENDLYSNNPLRQQQAYATLFGSYSNFAGLFASPQQLEQGLQNFNSYYNSLMSGTPMQSTNPDVNLYQQIFNQ